MLLLIERSVQTLGLVESNAHEMPALFGWNIKELQDAVLPLERVQRMLHVHDREIGGQALCPKLSHRVVFIVIGCDGVFFGQIVFREHLQQLVGIRTFGRWFRPLVIPVI